MHAYLAVKFYEKGKNRRIVEEVSAALAKAGVTTFCMARDQEEWGNHKYEPHELMRRTFERIDASDALIVEFSEKGVGLGIEAGYAYAKGKPVIIIAKEGSDISETIRGIASAVHIYKEPEDLAEMEFHTK